MGAIPSIGNHINKRNTEGDSFVFSHWTSDSSILSGLPTFRNRASLAFREVGGNYFLTVADYQLNLAGYIKGYTWNGSSWSAFTNLNFSFSVNAVPYGCFAEVYNSGVKYVYLTHDHNDTTYKAYLWNGSSWSLSTVYDNGMGTDSYGAPWHFKTVSGYDALIVGLNTGSYRGYQWSDGSNSWGNYTEAYSGATDVGDYAIPTVFNMMGSNYMIVGKLTGGTSSFKQTSLIYGNTWLTDTENVDNGLPDVGSNSAPCVMQIGSDYYCIIGNSVGDLAGFKAIAA